MKVNLTAEGCLIITAENEVESFALKAWGNEYFKDKSDSCGVTFKLQPVLLVGQMVKAGTDVVGYPGMYDHKTTHTA